MTDSSPAPTDAEASVRALRQVIEDGENALDARPINDLLADDVALYGPESAIDGRDAVAKHHRDLYASASAIDITFEVEDISVVGPVATDRGTYRYTAHAAGSDEDDGTEGEGRYLTVYERDDDPETERDWEILRIVWD